MTERRTRRSQVRIDALAMFLESQRTMLRAGALVVTTRDGKLLAGAGLSPDRLARQAIEIHEAREGAGPMPANVATWWLRAGGVQVVLASRGGRMSHELGSGVRRILSA